MLSCPAGCRHMPSIPACMPQSLQDALSRRPGALAQVPDLADLCCPTQCAHIAEMSVWRMHSVACRAAQLHYFLILSSPHLQVLQ